MGFTKPFKKNKKKPPPRPTTPAPGQTRTIPPPPTRQAPAVPKTIPPPPTRQAPAVPRTWAPPVPNSLGSRASSPGTHRLANANALAPRRGSVGNAAFTQAVTQQSAPAGNYKTPEEIAALLAAPAAPPAAGNYKTPEEIAAVLASSAAPPTTATYKTQEEIDAEPWLDEESESESDSEDDDWDDEEDEEEVRARQRAYQLGVAVDDLPPDLPKRFDTLKMADANRGEDTSSWAFTQSIISNVRVDMLRHGMAAPTDTWTEILGDRPRLTKALNSLWGWTDENVDTFMQHFASGRANKTWRVEYLQTERDRARYAITPGETWKDADNKPFDTSTMSSKFGGPGFAIFVMDEYGRVFAGQHRVGLFHHSSFLGGKEVAAAGELKVLKGDLVELTAKSGHYMPTPDHTQELLAELLRLGVKLAGVKVRVWRELQKVWIYDAEDFMDNGVWGSSGVDTGKTH